MARRRLIVTDNIERRLRRYVRRGEWLFVAGLVSWLLGYTLRFNDYFSTNADYFRFAPWAAFLGSKGWPAALGGLVLWICSNFQANNHAELEVMARMFAAAKTPQNWSRVRGGSQIVFLIGGWTIVALILVTTVTDPFWFGIVIMLYAVLNMCGIELYRRNVTEQLLDARFIPDETDPHRGAIMQRRHIQSRYLAKSHHWKEGLLFSGGAAATIISSGLLPFDIGHAVPFAILILALITNELIVRGWRKEREEELWNIDEHQIAMDIDRLEQ